MDPAARALRNVHPNYISFMAIILAAVAGLMLYFSYDHWVLLPLSAVVVLVSGFLDGLDGKVARLAGLADRRGDFLDHVLDRYADMLMIGGVAVSAWCSPYLGMMALIGVLLTSYMGTQAQAGQNMPHAGRFALASFLSFIGMPVEEIIKLFCSSPDFDHSKTAYQVRHITGDGLGKRYTPPECATMRTNGLCFEPDELCNGRRVTHPLTYYRIRSSDRKERKPDKGPKPS